MRRGTRRWAASVLVAALLLAGCGGSPGPTDEGTAGAVSSEQAGGGGTSDGTGGSSGASSASGGAGAAAMLTDTQRGHLVTDGKTTWDVTYANDTTVVDGDALDALTSADPSSGTYTFDTGAADAVGIDLSEGRVLLIAGTALRRITGTSSADGTTTVTTEQASLADAIQDGEVAWDVPIRFDYDQFLTATSGGSGSGSAAAVPGFGPGPGPDVQSAASGRVHLARVAMTMPDGRIIPVDDSEPSLQINRKPDSGQVEWIYDSPDGNKYQFRLTAHGDTVDILTVVSRGGSNDTKMAFRGEGTIGSLRAVASNEYGDGELASSDVNVNQLASNFHLSLAVAGAGVTPVNFDVPVPMLTYTWLVGPIPVTLDLTAEVIGKVDAKANASATAESSFTYRGDAGFSYEGTDVSMSGNTAIDEMDPKPADSAASMGLDVNAEFGLAFPVVSISILEQGIIPHLKVGAVIGSNLRWGGPAAGFPASSLCKSAYVREVVKGGYDLKFLGLSLDEVDKKLFEDEQKTQSEHCPDEK